MLSVQSLTRDHTEDQLITNINSPTDARAAIASEHKTEPNDYSPAVSQQKSRSQELVGTWTKQDIYAVDRVVQKLRDSNCHLTVTYTADGRFVWDSRQYAKDGSSIDDSLTGSYSIERGFLIAYHFDKPSPAALLRLPELFAFWPNQLLGKQTFRFQDGHLILGHDGEKIWINLKRSADDELIH